MQLLLRVMAECADERRARELSARLRAALAPLVARETGTPERYGKMPELFEFSFAFIPADESAFAALLAHGDAGWTHGGDADERSSVWNRTAGQVFLIPEARWVEVISTAPPTI